MKEFYKNSPHETVSMLEQYLRHCFYEARAHRVPPMLQISQPDEDGVLECRLMPGVVVDNAEELTDGKPTYAELRLVKTNELGGYIEMTIGKEDDFPWSDAVRFDKEKRTFLFSSKRSDELWDYNPGVRLKRGWNVFALWPMYSAKGARRYRLMWIDTTDEPAVWDGRKYLPCHIPQKEGIFEKFREQ